MKQLMAARVEETASSIVTKSVFDLTGGLAGFLECKYSLMMAALPNQISIHKEP